jgi:hypothetical protein
VNDVDRHRCDNNVNVSSGRWVRWTSIVIVSVASCLCHQYSLADDEDQDGPSAERVRSRPRHRIDVSAIFLDRVSADSANAIVGYTYNLNRKSNISVSVPFVDPNTSTGGNSGIGDTIMAFSYVPSATVSANPWVPRTVGSGFAALAPTGSAKDGRSLDTWVLVPFLGLVIPTTDRIFIAPQVGYVHSVDKTIAGTDLRLVYGELGVSFVAFNGFWSSYFPQFVRDLESDEWAVNHRLAVGKMLSTRFGLSIDYSFIERFNFGSDLHGQSGFDEQVELRMHFAF